MYTLSAFCFWYHIGTNMAIQESHPEKGEPATPSEWLRQANEQLLAVRRARDQTKSALPDAPSTPVRSAESPSLGRDQPGTGAHQIGTESPGTATDRSSESLATLDVVRAPDDLGRYRQNPETKQWEKVFTPDDLAALVDFYDSCPLSVDTTPSELVKSWEGSISTEVPPSLREIIRRYWSLATGSSELTLGHIDCRSKEQEITCEIRLALGNGDTSSRVTFDGVDYRVTGYYCPDKRSFVAVTAQNQERIEAALAPYRAELERWLNRHRADNAGTYGNWAMDRSDGLRVEHWKILSKINLWLNRYSRAPAQLYELRKKPEDTWTIIRFTGGRCEHQHEVATLSIPAPEGPSARVFQTELTERFQTELTAHEAAILRWYLELLTRTTAGSTVHSALEGLARDAQTAGQELQQLVSDAGELYTVTSQAAELLRLVQADLQTTLDAPTRTRRLQQRAQAQQILTEYGQPPSIL